MQYLLRRDNGNFNFFVSNGVFVNVLSVATVTLNTWTHVAGTWDGAVLRIYVNGVASGTAAATGNFPSETNPVWIAEILQDLENILQEMLMK